MAKLLGKKTSEFVFLCSSKTPVHPFPSAALKQGRFSNFWLFLMLETVISVHSRSHSDWSGCTAWLKPPAGEGRLHSDMGLLDINQTTSIGIKKGGGGCWGTQRHMATWACGQGAIQSNEIAPGRKRKIMMEGWWEGESREQWVVGNITSLCIPPRDHGNSRTRSTAAVHWAVFSSLLKQKLEGRWKKRRV